MARGTEIYGLIDIFPGLIGTPYPLNRNDTSKRVAEPPVAVTIICCTAPSYTPLSHRLWKPLFENHFMPHKLIRSACLLPLTPFCPHYNATTSTSIEAGIRPVLSVRWIVVCLFLRHI